jgi:hypothetical protein
MACDISTVMIPTAKKFSEYFWRALYVTHRHTTTNHNSAYNTDIITMTKCEVARTT